MLKWSIANKQQQQPSGSDRERRQSSGLCTIYTPQAPVDGSIDVGDSRRRHSASRRRRSSDLMSARRRFSQKRSSLCLETDKENQYTSTPIKESDVGMQQALDAFRDVSNLTPKDNSNKQRHRKRLYDSPRCTKPKKKLCIKQHSFIFDENESNFFKPFESVDSHIEGIQSITCGCAGKPLKKTYAPTLPTYSVDYSPTNEPILMCQPKIDHVNDFLQRISMLTSAEDVCLTELPGYRPKMTKEDSRVEDDLHDRSSFINELSLDKIVDAILDSSNSFEKDENNENETKEENILNEQQLANSSRRAVLNNSGDSGFRSNSTSTLASTVDSKSLTLEKTIINLEETFNERCIDPDNLDGKSSIRRKRKNSEQNSTLKLETLKRQKCIRRRKNRKLSSDLNDTSFDSTFIIDPQVTNRITPPLYITDDSSSSSSSFASSDNFDDYFINNNKATIELAIQYEIANGNNEILLSIFRCSNLKRMNGHPVNAYIKVALSERTESGRRKHRGTLQRTAVQGESSEPAFLHTFRVPLGAADHQKVLYVEVWHRDRNTRRSEFLGCTSFQIKDATKKKISGTYRLQPHYWDRCLSSTPIRTNKQDEEMCDTSIDELIGQDSDQARNNNRFGTPNKALLSQQQKDADENLFLRYLELDPIEGPDAAPAAVQRKATGKNYNGRTPFTTTRVLKRAPKTGFGFSVVWTHPPRIEKVEKGLPADKSGIQTGDYIIFVDKHNVVMMPELDILKLIRSLGNVLTLEIFRRDSQTQKPITNNNGSVPCKKLTYNFETESTTGSVITALPPPAPPSTTTPRRPSTVCSTNTASIEYNRKKLHLPQVTFSSEVGSGIIV